MLIFQGVKFRGCSIFLVGQKLCMSIFSGITFGGQLLLKFNFFGGYKKWTGGSISSRTLSFRFICPKCFYLNLYILDFMVLILKLYFWLHYLDLSLSLRRRWSAWGRQFGHDDFHCRVIFMVINILSSPRYWAKYEKESKDCRVKAALLRVVRRFLTPPPTSTNVERLFSVLNPF